MVTKYLSFLQTPQRFSTYVLSVIASMLVVLWSLQGIKSDFMLQDSHVMTSVGVNEDIKVLNLGSEGPLQPAESWPPHRGPHRPLIVNATLIFHIQLRHPMKSNLVAIFCPINLCESIYVLALDLGSKRSSWLLDC